MIGSIERVRTLLDGQLPDRPPIHDMILNDAVLAFFGGRELLSGDAEQVVLAALPRILDSTRLYGYLPRQEGGQGTECAADDGRKIVGQRWTTWVEHKIYRDAEAWAAEKRMTIEKHAAWSLEDKAAMDRYMEDNRTFRDKLNNVFFFWGIPGPGLMGMYEDVGLEQFSYFLVDYPEIVSEYLEFRTTKAIRFIQELPEGLMEGAFIGEDIAFKTTSMFSPAFLRKEFFPRLARIIEKLHEKKVKVMFHSDGNLMGIVNDLAGCGVDVLNPFETAAGMDLAAVHKAYPGLIIAGGIDVSQLLPYGRPDEVRDTVKASIELAEGKIMVGSSTEVHNGVPLENFLAMHETVMNYRFSR